MRLLREELLKLYKNRWIWVILFFLLLGLLMPFISYSSWVDSVGGDAERFYEYSAAYEGQPVTDLKVTDAQMRELLFKDTRSMSPEEKMEHQLEQDRGKASLRYEIFLTIQDSFDQIKKIGLPDLYYETTGIMNIYEITMGVFGMLFVCCPIVILVTAPIFSNEHASNMTSNIVSSVLGRKETVRAKFHAAVSLSLVFVTIFYFGSSIIFLTLFRNWDDLGMSTMHITPGNSNSSVMLIDTSAGGIILWGYLYCALGVMAIVGILCLVSCAVHHTLLSVGLSVVLVYVPEMMARMIPSIYFSLFPTVSMQSGRLFGTLGYMNIFGFKVFHIIPPLFFCVIVAVACYLICPKAYHLFLGLPKEKKGLTRKHRLE